MVTRRRVRGLTLIELMVTLVVLAILTSVVYPLYQQQVRKARRAEAKSTLMALALAQERYYTVNGQYGSDAELGDEYDEVFERLTDRDGDGNADYYDIDIDPDDPDQQFTLTATAQGPQLDDTDCRTFVVTQTGERTSTDDGGGGTLGCW